MTRALLVQRLWMALALAGCVGASIAAGGLSWKFAAAFGSGVAAFALLEWLALDWLAPPADLRLRCACGQQLRIVAKGAGPDGAYRCPRCKRVAARLAPRG